MKQKLISVIVPVYNSEKYVNRCIDSILNQTYENLEVILVDGGSSDGSLKICETWAEKDNRIKVAREKTSTVAAARNLGISYATGDYIAFVDNDDWLRPEMYDTMMGLAALEKADVTVCKFINVDHKYNRINIKEINLNAENFKNPIYFFLNNNSKNGHEKIIGCCNRLLIKKELLEKVKFDESLKFGENILFVLNLIKHAKKIAISNEYLYNHFNDSSVKVFSETYLQDLEDYHKALTKYFHGEDLYMNHLINYDYICKVIKAYKHKKHFAKNMKNLVKTNSLFAEALSKNDYKKIKALKFGSNLKLHLIYNKKWNLLKLFIN